MGWTSKRAKQKKRKKSANTFYSISKKLRRDGKTNEAFEVMMGNLLLEDLIALKLELAAKAAGGALFGLPIYMMINRITREAVYKTALSICRTKFEAGRFLGMDQSNLGKLEAKFGTLSFFEEEEAERLEKEKIKKTP